MAQGHWHHFHYRNGEMTGLDRTAKTITLARTVDEEGREISPESQLAYDTLIVAVGSVTNDFGTPGAKEFAVPLETPEQAARFNRRLVNACVRAQSQETPVRPGQLHVAIIGAGATGTELAAELHHTARAIIAYGLDRIDPEHDLRIVLIEAADRVLPALPQRISASTAGTARQAGRGSAHQRTGRRGSGGRRQALRWRGHSVRTGGVVGGCAGPGFSGQHRRAGNQPYQSAGGATDAADHAATTDIFAIGDCAACPRPGFPQNVPPRAQAAHQQSDFMVRQFGHLLDRPPALEFEYRDFGSLVSLGKYSTIGSLMGSVIGRSFLVEGYFARLMYRSLYKMHEAALHGRGRTLLGLVAPGARPAPTVKLH